VALVAWLAARLWALNVVRTAVPEFEARHGSIDPVRWEHAPTEPGVRAGRLLRSAALLFDRSDPVYSQWSREYREARNRGAGVAVREETLRAVAEQNHWPLELVRDAARRDDCVLHEHLPDSFGTPSFDFPALFSLAQIELQRSRQALSTGDEDLARAGFSSVLALAHCLQGSPTQVPMSIGLAIERMELNLLRTLVEVGDSRAISDDLLARLEPSSRRIQFAGRLITEAATIQRVARVSTESLRNAEFASYMSRWWNPFAVDGFVEAMSLRGIDRAIQILDDPEAPGRHPAARFPLWDFDRYYFDSFADHWWTVQRGIEAHDAARRLALLALTLEARRSGGANEAELERICREHSDSGTPLLGETIRIERDSVGGFVLSLPETGRRWSEIRAHLSASIEFPWTWRIQPASPAGG
jgi:hypothetical protein